MIPLQQLQALADPTRLEIFELVRGEPASVSSLSDRLPITQPAVSQHLRVLREASLVRSEPQGRRRIYAADPTGIAILRAWTSVMWDGVLDAFVAAAEEGAS